MKENQKQTEQVVAELLKVVCTEMIMKVYDVELEDAQYVFEQVMQECNQYGKDLKFSHKRGIVEYE